MDLDSKVFRSASTPGPAAAPVADRVPPQAWFVGSAVFHYLGPSFAVLLFASVPVAGVAWLRIAAAAAVFVAWRRPRRILAAAAEPGARGLVLALGVVFAVMNVCFYRAIDVLPLGTVAAIEFVGPIAVALAAARSRRNVAALALAVAGVAFLTDVRIAGTVAGLGWAAANAALFALYIVLAHRLAGRGSGRVDPRRAALDRLAAAMVVAAVVVTPIGLAAAAPAFGRLPLLLAGIGVGVSSSVIPYVCDQAAMRRLPRATYALFVALLPATAVIVGVIVLRQIPTAAELTGVGLVIAGVLVHREVRASD